MSNKNVDQVQVNEKLVGEVTGGQRSAGYVCTISGECNGGTSCWPWWMSVLSV